MLPRAEGGGRRSVSVRDGDVGSGAGDEVWGYGGVGGKGGEGSECAVRGLVLCDLERGFSEDQAEEGAGGEVGLRMRGVAGDDGKAVLFVFADVSVQGHLVPAE